jgi:HD-GYP domain-containing protein (c-di-GMP phosphodiesterase class II)
VGTDPDPAVERAVLQRGRHIPDPARRAERFVHGRRRLLRSVEVVLTRQAVDPDNLLAANRERLHTPLVVRERVVRWTSTLVFLAAATTFALVGPAQSHASIFAVLCGIAAYAIAYSIDVETLIGSATPTELVFIPMLFALPPRAVPLTVAAACALAQLVGSARNGDPLERVVVAVGNAWFSLAPAVVILAFHDPSPTRLSTWAIVAAALAAQLASDFVRFVVSERAALGAPVRRIVQSMAQVATIDLLLAPVGLLIAVAVDATRWSLLLPVPLLALIMLYARERSSRFDSILQLSHAYRGTAFLLGDVVEADDAYTGAHSRSVVDLVLAVCDGVGVDEDTRRRAEFAAMLHDVGKIRIPAEIINKPGPLSTEERAIVRTHTIEGERLLAPIGGLLAEVGAVVRSCHERWDGDGYPDGLAGEAIPVEARIVAACDAWDAMTSDRPYRQALAFEEALLELRGNRGRQFDPAVVDALVAIVAQPARDRVLV